MTSATTTYLEITPEDTQFLISKCIQLQSYFGELSLSKDKEVKDVYKWYTTSSKQLPYSNQMKRYNSPQSFIAGTLNNLMFGTQRDISETQSQNLQTIINAYTQMAECISKDYKVTLQKQANVDTILFVENLWTNP